MLIHGLVLQLVYHLTSPVLYDGHLYQIRSKWFHDDIKLYIVTVLN